MTYQDRGDGFIVRDDGVTIPADPNNTDYVTYLAWLTAGNQPTPAPAPSIGWQIATLTQAVQNLLDAKARSYNYDDTTTAVTYADEPSVEKFQTEGRAFRQWRSDVWQAAYAYLALVQAGQKSFPTLDELPGLLPPFPLDTPPSGT